MIHHIHVHIIGTLFFLTYVWKFFFCINEACHGIFYTQLDSLLFSSCLRSWLENDTSCPTCRQSLASDLQPEQEEERQPRGMAAFMMGRGIRRNHFFHFDGKFVKCCS